MTGPVCAFRAGAATQSTLAVPDELGDAATDVLPLKAPLPLLRELMFLLADAAQTKESPEPAQEDTSEKFGLDSVEPDCCVCSSFKLGQT